MLADAFFRRGVVLQKLERHEAAQSCYERALTLDPRRVEALNNMADVHFRRGDLDAALQELQEALAIDSTFVNALYGIGYYYECTGDAERAIAFYRKAQGFEPARLRLWKLEQNTGAHGDLVSE